MIRYERQIVIFLGTIFFLIVIIYGFFKISPVILGPEIVLKSPSDGEIVEDTNLIVRGSSKRITKLLINGSKVSLTKDGNFETNLAIWRGHTILVVEGYDRFGRKVSITKNIGTK